MYLTLLKAGQAVDHAASPFFKWRKEGKEVGSIATYFFQPLLGFFSLIQNIDSSIMDLPIIVGN